MKGRGMTRNAASADALKAFFDHIKGLLYSDKLVARQQHAPFALVSFEKCEKHGYEVNFVRAEANCAGLSSRIVLRSGTKYLEFTKG
jgi:hypothetical protein